MAGARPAPPSDRSPSWGSGAAGSGPSWAGVPGWGPLEAGELLGSAVGTTGTCVVHPWRAGSEGWAGFWGVTSPATTADWRRTSYQGTAVSWESTPPWPGGLVTLSAPTTT